MSGGQHVCLVFGISSATASSSVLGRLGQQLLSPLIGLRERESEREKEREGKREEWEAMDSGIAFLGRGGRKDQDFCWVSIDCPFTDLSKEGDTTGQKAHTYSHTHIYIYKHIRIHMYVSKIIFYPFYFGQLWTHGFNRLSQHVHMHTRGNKSFLLNWL